MSGFSAEWLTLREPLDAGSRSAELALTLRSRLPADDPVRVVDLGAGTGANLRYLAPLLGGRQQWLLVDDDPALLEAMRDRLERWAEPRGGSVAAGSGTLRVVAGAFDCTIECLELDLATAIDALELPERSLVTASALLDLVSGRWLATLARRCREASASALFALTYDGRIECEPAHPDDALALELFNRHQRGEKGFGPALGPDAPRATRAAFADRGFALAEAASDWRLAPSSAALQRELLAGWHDAALEIAPGQRARLAAWRRAHRETVDAGGARLTVGHRDFAAWIERPAR